MKEGPASTSRIAMYAAAIAILLAAVFYGLNSQSTSPTSTAQNPPAASTAQNQPTPATAAVRDVTPNREPGTTTGTAAAPAQVQQPPQSGPTGQEVDRSKGSAQ